MKRQVFSLIAAMAMATGLALASQQTAQNPPAAQQKAGADTSLTGCLVQGSRPDVFVLNNARTADQAKTDKGKSYIVVASAVDVGLAEQLNHEVTVSGVAESKTAPATGTKIDEKDLPKFSAKSIMMVSDRCEAGVR